MTNTGVRAASATSQGAMGPAREMVVIGSGAAGITAARTAASLGAEVVLVERDRMGGDCLWTGCVPSKSIIAAGSIARQLRRGSDLGVAAGTLAIDFEAVMEHVHSCICEIEPTDSRASLESDGITVLAGNARFRAPGLLEVSGVPLHFRQAILAMGAAPWLPEIPGLADVDPLTSEGVWGLTRLPERLVVLGAGGIGCELAQAFTRLGCAVTLVEQSAPILPAIDPAAAGMVAAAMTRDGVRIVTRARVRAVHDNQNGAGELELDTADSHRIGFDRLLVTTGRRPRTSGIGLDRIGVALDGRGFVRVSRTLRTTNPRVWAAGDLTPLPQFTHAAGFHGSLAASNAVLGLRRRADPGTIPRVTFTDPEVAAVGVPTDEPPPDGVTILSHENGAVDRAIAENQTSGVTRIAVDRRGRILGATIVGPRAGESITELTLAIRHGLRTKDIAATIHPYPTFSDGIWLAAVADVRQRLKQPAAARITRLLRRIRTATLR